MRLTNSQSHNPYVYCINNPLIYFDPWGLDWYVASENGALHWYDGTYEEDEIPEGYKWLGDDSYFGPESKKQISEEYSESEYLSEQESVEYATRYGFKKVEDENFAIYRTYSDSYAKPSGEYLSPDFVTISELDVINESYTYVKKGYLPNAKRIWSDEIPKGKTKVTYLIRSEILWKKPNLLQRLGVNRDNNIYPISLNHTNVGFNAYKNWNEYWAKHH